MISIIGVDLGQQNDYTAICVVNASPMVYERSIQYYDPEFRRSANRIEHIAGPPVTYAVRHLERLLGSPYPDVVRRIAAIQQVLAGDPLLVVDHTGCGRPVVDMIREAGLDPVAVTITGGDAVNHDGMDFRVPKRDLIGALVVSLQTNHLKIARALPDAKTLTAELLNFRVKINVKTAHDQYEAWREGQHDDLVLSVGLAVWVGDYLYSHQPEEIIFDDTPYEISPY